jgi:hypothetical protein
VLLVAETISAVRTSPEKPALFFGVRKRAQSKNFSHVVLTSFVAPEKPFELSSLVPPAVKWN